MKKTLLWMKAIWMWIKKANHLWRAISVAALAILYTYINNNEPSIRITGLVLQVLGIATVAWGIKETRALFGQPSLMQVGVKWLKSFPTYSGRIVSGAANISLGDASLSGRGYISIPIDPTSSVEDRLAALEKNLNYINDRISRTENDLEQSAKLITETIRSEKAIQAQEHQATHQKIEAVSTGGLHISATGALWLLIGVIMSTVPNEIIRLTS